MRIENYVLESPLCTLDRVHRQTFGEVNETLRPFGLSFLQGLVLVAIHLERRPVFPGDLCKAFSLSRVAISQVLTRLEELGYVRRKMDEDDARKVQISIHPAEKGKIQRLMNVFHRMQDRYERRLGASTVRSIQAGLEKLAR